MTKNFLRRYTDLPSLIYTLSKRKLTLSNPILWDDINDSHYLLRYRDQKRLGSVLALCFTQTDDSYQLWRVFANGPSGVCVIFKRDKLLSAFTNDSKIRMGNVNYFTLKKIRKHKPKLDQLPFVKRWPFKNEGEFRIIYNSKTDNLASHDISISLASISRILLSPWLHKNLSDSIKAALRSIDGCSTLDIVRSTVVDNEEWKRIGGFAV